MFHELEKPQIVSKSEISDRANKLAASIASKNLDGRPLDKIIKNCYEGLAIEQALVNLNGYKHNPLEFDLSNPDSYSYDVYKEDPYGLLKIECKKVILGKKDSFPSFDLSKFKTFEKNKNIPLLFAGATVRQSQDKSKFIVQFVVVVEPDALFDNIIPTGYPETYGENNYFFDWTKVSPNQCWICSNVKKRLQTKEL